MAKVLIVDDSRVVREIVRNTLGASGHEVVAATRGEEALKLCAELPFQLIITDINMPAMDGITLTAELRKLPQVHGVPILIMTGEGGATHKKRGIRAGASGWVTKPFGPESLTAAVHQLTQ